ncbi:MAG: hypothetical protein Q8Q09_12970 [Deltaproteobacteria bacterium]|nr:hypothetical protein [Deltaproteobacteria bacterium]
MTHPTPRLVPPSTLCLLRVSAFVSAVCISPWARAQSAPESAGPAPHVSLLIAPRPASLRWVFALRNDGPVATEVVVNRYLLSVEVTPPAPPETPNSGRRRRRQRMPRPTTCRASLMPRSTTELARTTLAPGERYEEGFDLRELCGVRLRRAVVPGATLQFRYGPRVGRRPSFRSAVVWAETPTPIVSLDASPMPLEGDVANFPPAPSQRVPEGALTVIAPTTVSATRVMNARFTARLRTRGELPQTVFYVPSMWSLDVVTPEGQKASCIDPRLGYVGLPEYLRSVRRRSGPSASLVAGYLCDTGLLDQPGIYMVRAVFSSLVAPTTQRHPSHRGVVRSPWFWLHISQGRPDLLYRPLPLHDPHQQAAQEAEYDTEQ